MNASQFDRNETSVIDDGVLPSFCRVCHNFCPILVTVADGKAISVTGDRENEVYEGYTCVKGRAIPDLMNHRDRLLHSLKRTPEGFVPITSGQAMDEIAEKLTSIMERYGGSAIATYLGTYAYITNSLIMPIANAFSDAIGSQRRLSPITIDQPGKVIAPTMLGSWLAPTVPFDSANVALFLGLNPLVSHYLAPALTPGKWLDDAKTRSVKLIVIDPRRTEVARRAFLHLQPRPGQDIPVLAAMLRVILDEGLGDMGFVQENVNGLDRLRSGVGFFTPEEAGRRAGVSPDDIVLAARTWATAGPGWAYSGTGPSMSQSSTLLEYLLQCLKTVCGYYQRAGDRIGNPGTLTPARQAKAQAVGPPAAGANQTEDSYEQSLAGEPIGLAADKMHGGSEDRISALISVSGNPVSAWPDQQRTIKGLGALELLVQIDPWMSETSKVADYVIAPTMVLEASATTLFTDLMDAMSGPSLGCSHAQYTPRLVDRPPESDLIEEWQFFYGLATRMGLDLTLQPLLPHPDSVPVALDMANMPTTDELLERTSRGGRISLDEVKRHPHGAPFPEPAVVVEPKDPGWEGRFDVGHTRMMTDLRKIGLSERTDNELYPLQLTSRRLMNSFNSSCRHDSINRGRAYNPAFMHPSDLDHLGLEARDIIEIRAEHASIRAVVEPDVSVRPGCISMTHGFGGSPGDDTDVLEVGSSTARLASCDDELEPYSHQPRMSGICVAVEKVTAL